MFSSPAISEHDLFQEDGSFRLICFGSENKVQTEEPEYSEYQEEFKTNLASFLREKCSSGDQNFLRDFVYACTGQGYIPDVDTSMAKNFIINIEFESVDSNSLPIFWPCTNTVVIPLSAYEGDIEKFEKKLVQAMSLCEGSFDME